jgi:hypothetical protein
MRKFIVALFVALALMLSACATEVTAGTVTDKEYVAEHTEMQDITEQDCEYKKVGKKKKRVCETEVVGEEEVTIPAEYTLDLEDDKGNTGTVEVTEAEYDSVEVGDFFDSEK